LGEQKRSDGQLLMSLNKTTDGNGSFSSQEKPYLDDNDIVVRVKSE
jgi:hypothetical protein